MNSIYEIEPKIETQTGFAVTDCISSAVELPREFVEWQMTARREAYAHIVNGKRPARFSAHLPMVVSLKQEGEFKIHAATKGTGFTPKDEHLDYYVARFDECLAGCMGRPWKETLKERIAVAREFYEHQEHIDFRRLGLLEIFEGQTYRNILDDPRITLHYIGEGPDYPSFQVNGMAQIVGPEDQRFQFIYLARQLFEHDRFHIHQPNYPFGYLAWVHEVYDKSPFHGRAGKRFKVSHPKTPDVELKNILFPLDNSRFAEYSMKIGLQIAGHFNARVTGFHAYAAKLHDSRFKQMEAGLPSKYQEPKELERQRRIHDSLITQGLELISDSYLTILSDRCQSAYIEFAGKQREGKNYSALLAEIDEGEYDLVIMGAHGLGEAPGSTLGSVTERVSRRAKTDMLVVKNQATIGGKIIVAVDGSPQSFAGVLLAVTLAETIGAQVEAVAVFDPHFHTIAFRGLEGVLSPEAGSVFRFQEQERLHNEIIDKGIAKIYRDHLETAKQISTDMGFEIETTLLEGKPFQSILTHIEETQPSLLVVGRLGVHADKGLDLGATAENLLRLASCHVLLVSRKYTPPNGDTNPQSCAEEIPWTPEALERLENIPSFARSFAQKAIDDYARERGLNEVNITVMAEARERMGM